MFLTNYVMKELTKLALIAVTSSLITHLIGLINRVGLVTKVMY